MPLNATQIANAQLITDYGTKNGYSDLNVEIAIKTAYLESSLGLNMHNAQPGVTAAGMFGYNDVGWSTHAGLGDKSNTGNQISAFFSDLSSYAVRYQKPEVQSAGISFAEYAYIKHHDGPNATDFSTNSLGLRTWRGSDFNMDVTQADHTPFGAHGFDLYDPVYLVSHANWFVDTNYVPVGSVEMGPLESVTGADQD